jgi:hypothetical protein
VEFAHRGVKLKRVLVEFLHGQVMGQKLLVVQRHVPRALDEALFFDAYAVEPLAVKGAQVGGVRFQIGFDFVQVFA